MNKTSVALLFVGDSMYPQDTLKSNIAEISAHLAGLSSIDLQVTEKVMNEEDAVAVADKIYSRKFDLIITCFVSWHITPYIMRVLKDYTSVPVLVWGVGGITSEAGCLYSPAAAAGVTALVPVLKEFGFTYEVIQEKADEPHRFTAVESFIRVIGAAKKIRSSRIGLVGYADMGLYSCSYDRSAIFKKIGIDIEDYIGFEITELMNNISADELEPVISDIKNNMQFQNSIPDKSLDRAARLYLALKSKVDSRGLDAVSIKCVFGTTPILGFNPCLAQSLLAGKDLSVICECDAHGLVTNLILNSITGNTSAFMEHYEVVDDAVLVGVCGFIPRDFVDGTVKIRSANLGESISGISNVSKVKTGQVTFGRFYEEKGEYKLFITRAEAVEPPKWSELGWAEPTPDFPSLLLKLEMPVDKYIKMVPGQHIVMAYGDHVEDIKKLCELLGIEAVY